MLRHVLAAPALLVVLVAGLLLPAPAGAVLEDYPSYQPQTRCSPQAKPGTQFLGRWLVRRYGGGHGPISRSCRGSGTSEHLEGRAFDWMLDARRRQDRQTARAFLQRLWAEDAQGNEDAWARRMGVMYVIWDDTIYSAWNHYEPERYRSSSCERRPLRKCSTTLRHRNHVHISLTRKAARGRTSWFVQRMVSTGSTTE